MINEKTLALIQLLFELGRKIDETKDEKRVGLYQEWFDLLATKVKEQLLLD